MQGTNRKQHVKIGEPDEYHPSHQPGDDAGRVDRLWRNNVASFQYSFGEERAGDAVSDGVHERRNPRSGVYRSCNRDEILAHKNQWRTFRNDDAHLLPTHDRQGAGRAHKKRLQACTHTLTPILLQWLIAARQEILSSSIQGSGVEREQLAGRSPVVAKAGNGICYRRADPLWRPHCGSAG